MAGMFYTLIEVAEKLGKTEDQIRQMVQDGQLREFRDGPKLLFKKDEVDAMAGQSGVPDDTLGLEDESGEGSTFGLASDEDVSDIEPGEETEETEENLGTDDEFDLELDASGLDLAMGGSDIDLDLAASRAGEDTEDLGGDTDIQQPEQKQQDQDTQDQQQDRKEPQTQPQDQQEELELAPEDQQPTQQEEEPPEKQPKQPQAEESAEDIDLSLEPEDSRQAQPQEDDQFAPALEDSGDLELSDMQLEDETGDEFGDIDMGDTSDSEGTKAETEGIQVLGEEDSGYKLTDDSLGETAEVTLESDEPSLDEDVNLESFGSGSGLLDLSLQADDTSLGAVLDDIIPGAGGGEEAGGGAMPEEGDMLSEAAQGLEEPAPVEAVPEQPGGGIEDLGAAEAQAQPQGAQQFPAAAMAYQQPAPDSSSNIFGSMLIVPLLISVFTIIVSLAGANNIAPSLLTATEGIIWYIAGGLAVVALIWMFVGIAAGGSKSPGKPKKAKAVKTKKEKKTKKAKPAKPKKEKKKKKK